MLYYFTLDLTDNSTKGKNKTTTKKPKKVPLIQTDEPKWVPEQAKVDATTPVKLTKAVGRR